MNDTTIGEVIRTGLQTIQGAGKELLELTAQLIDSAADTPMQYVVIGAVVLYCSVVVVHLVEKVRGGAE